MKHYIVKIYSGTLEDHEFEYGSIMKERPQTITWIKSPGYATIEKVKE